MAAWSAAAVESTTSSSASRDWTITLGIEAGVLPSYAGSDRYELRPVPLINIRRVGTPRDFSSPRDGASVAILESGRFHLGPTAKLRAPRRETDDSNLAGLGGVGWAIEAGLFAEYWPVDWLRTRVEVRQGIGGHHGVVSDVTADYVAPVTPQLTLSAGPRMEVATAKAQRPYFGIDASQAALSGLPVYSAEGGVQSYGFGAQARYELNVKWATHMFVEYAALVGSAARSPIVAQHGSRNQVQVGSGVTYAFDTRGLW